MISVCAWFYAVCRSNPTAIFHEYNESRNIVFLMKNILMVVKKQSCFDKNNISQERQKARHLKGVKLFDLGELPLKP